MLLMLPLAEGCFWPLKELPGLLAMAPGLGLLSAVPLPAANFDFRSLAKDSTNLSDLQLFAPPVAPVSKRLSSLLLRRAAAAAEWATAAATAAACADDLDLSSMTLLSL